MNETQPLKYMCARKMLFNLTAKDVSLPETDLIRP